MNRRVIVSLLFGAAAVAWTSAVRAEVVFTNIYDEVGTGFNDPTLGPARKAAWEYAQSIWASRLVDLYTLGDEVISVRARFQDLGGTPTSATIGSAGPNLFRRDFSAVSPKFLPGTFYADPLANHLAGVDLSPGNPEILANFNSRLDTGTILGGRTFYYGLDANPSLTPPSQIDFVTVALHELGHGLGFASSISSSGAYTYPSSFDRFLYRGATDQYLIADYPDNPAGDAQRAADLISGDLYFRSAGTIALNGLDGLEMHAPNPYVNGSSTSHLDVVNPDLMNPNYSIPRHSPSINDLTILSDIGWDVIPVPEPASLMVMTLGVGLLMKRRSR